MFYNSFRFGLSRRALRDLCLLVGALFFAGGATLSAQRVPVEVSAEKGTASVAGAVVDATGAAIPTARIVLNDAAERVAALVQADERGDFLLPELAAGVYRITVEAPGFQPLVAPSFRLNAGQALAAGRLELAVSGSRADVEVNVTEHALAEEQVKAALEQRAFGVFPNFYSSYIWDAAPLSTGQKLHLAFRSIFDPVSFVTTGAAAGVEQANNTYPGYGQGAEGYAKRYGAAFAGHITARIIGSALLPTVFHQDPRYFYMGPGESVGKRVGYAVSRSVVARTDSGHWRPAYASVLGAFAAGAIANSYHPGQDRGAGLVLRDGAVQIGARAFTNLIREFVLRRISTNVPDFEKGKPPPIPMDAPPSPSVKTP